MQRNRAKWGAAAAAFTGLILLLGCSSDSGGSNPGSGGTTAGSGGSGAAPQNYPISYKGTATLRRTIAIEFDDMSSIECHSTGQWSGTVTQDKITIEGKVDKKATFLGGTTVCTDVQDSVFLTGTHDGEHFTIEFDYESTPIKMTGSFGSAELLGSYDAAWSGKVAGFGGISKTEDVSLALPIEP